MCVCMYACIHVCKCCVLSSWISIYIVSIELGNRTEFCWGNPKSSENIGTKLIEHLRSGGHHITWLWRFFISNCTYTSHLTDSWFSFSVLALPSPTSSWLRPECKEAAAARLPSVNWNKGYLVTDCHGSTPTVPASLPSLPLSRTWTLKLYRWEEPGIFSHVSDIKGRKRVEGSLVTHGHSQRLRTAKCEGTRQFTICIYLHVARGEYIVHTKHWTHR